MKLYTLSLFTAIASFSTYCLSADIYVEPGNGTIQTAINTASSGDTLVLPSGNYSGQDDTIVFDKPLTLRAESAESVVSINASILTHPQLVEPLERLRFQGLRINGPHWCFGGYLKNIKVNNLELLEVTAECHDLDLEAKNEVTVIGSRLTSNASALNIKTQKATILGSTLDFGQGLRVTANEVNLIGNEITSYEHRANIFYGYDSGNKFIAANRFNYRMTARPRSEYIPIKSTREFALLTGSSSNINNAVYKNNVFKIDLTNFTRFTDPGKLERIALLKSESKFDYFYNNVIDFAGLSISQPSAGLSDLGAMIVKELGAFEGNAVVNYDDDLFSAVGSANVKYNLGFNNATQLNAENNNIEADPLFNTDYSLKADSPAIDAGPVDAHASDIDLTRNDIGVYGGSWHIGQYDVQRLPDATGPFVYPVLDAQAGIANGELKLKLISYPRLK
jgi:hypothetical protein